MFIICNEGRVISGTTIDCSSKIANQLLDTSFLYIQVKIAEHVGKLRNVHVHPAITVDRWWHLWWHVGVQHQPRQA